MNTMVRLGCKKKHTHTSSHEISLIIISGKSMSKELKRLINHVRVIIPLISTDQSTTLSNSDAISAV